MSGITSLSPTQGTGCCGLMGSLSIDGYRDPYSEWLMGIRQESTGADFIRDYYLRDSAPPYLFGVHKNYDPNAGGWRCFAEPGYACGNPQAHYPPQAVPLIMELPVLSGASIPCCSVTPGATLIPEYTDWQAFDVWAFSPASCSMESYAGRIWHKVYAFVADAVWFGGDLGAQSNVLIIEEEQTGSPPVVQHFERYYYANGLGRIQESRDGVVTAWNLQTAGDYSINSICPYGSGAW